MINVKDQVFRLETKGTTYAFRINEGYPEHLYYGRRIVDSDFTATALKNTIELFNTTSFIFLSSIIFIKTFKTFILHFSILSNKIILLLLNLLYKLSKSLTVSNALYMR